MRFLKQAPARAESDAAEVRETVAGIIADVRGRGETAVRKYSRRFDDWSPEVFRVSDSQLAHAHEEVPDELRESIDFAIAQVRNFAELQRAAMRGVEMETRPGVTLGHRHLPVERVGAYVPGGRYSLIASCYMSVVTARTAGVDHVTVCTPARMGQVSPGLLYAAHESGADAVYAVGGVQALAAMAFGALEDMAPSDMIVGPGNRYVVEAKRQLFGQVGVDLLAGPTEIGILADDTTDPFIAACDLIGQAEHDPYSRAVLISTSAEVAQAVLGQIDDHLSAIATADVARECWDNGGEVVVVDDVEELIATSDRYALEHVEVLTGDAEGIAERLRHYGSLFVGEETTVAYGDKVSGPNHILPTGRAARFSGGLSVGHFLKTVTFQRATRAASADLARHCEAVSQAEGMVSHARTAAVRRDRYRPTASHID